MNPNHIPHHVGLRTAIGECDVEELHLECRFPDGMNGPAVVVDGDYRDLAVLLMAFLNDKRLVSLVRERLTIDPLYVNGLVSAQDADLPCEHEMEELLALAHRLHAQGHEVTIQADGCGRFQIERLKLDAPLGDYRSCRTMLLEVLAGLHDNRLVPAPEGRPIDADIRLGTPGALCSLHIAARVVAMVSRAGQQYAVVSVAGGREQRAAVYKSYAMARAALVGLVPAQVGGAN